MKLLNDWHPENPETAWTLPSRYFYDTDHFEAEKERVFMDAWHVIGHKNELRQPGQYIVRDLFDQSVVATRDKTGNVHAFYNVCQHRGTRLVAEERGVQNGVFRCPYHSWCYGLDGGLMGAPRSDRLQNFDKRQHNIPKVRVEEFGGFLYFNMNPDAPSMAELFPGAEAEIRRIFPNLDEMRLIEEKDFLVPANWKVIMDNAIEGYHFKLSGPIHVDLASLINFDGYRLKQHDNWWTYIGPSDLTAKEAYGQPLQEKPHPGDCFFNIGLWPHNTFYTFPFSGFLGSFLIIPLEAEKTLLRFGYYASRETLSPVTKACMKWMNEKLGPEDIDLNVAVQRGLRSRGYSQGRYMIDPERSNESEHLVYHFHTLVHRAIHG